MIPKIIHFCWFGTKKMSKLEQQCIDSWKKIMPDYELMFWNEDNFDININSYCKEAYENKKYAFVADVCRLNVLYKYGGIYLDTDVMVLKKFDNLLNFQLIFGMEDDSVISTACILSEKESPYLKKIIERYDNFNFIVNSEFNTTPNTYIISQMLISDFSLSLNKEFNFNNEFVNIFPQYYFSPKSYQSNEIMDTKNSYCIHLFNSSWLPISIKIKKQISNFTPLFIKRIYRIIRKYLP